jgi:Acyl-CoA dehydrogenase, C-terminal domain
MRALHLARPDDTLSVLCLGAHSDDIEIGAGGTILEWIASGVRLEVAVVRAERHRAARRRGQGFGRGIPCRRHRQPNPSRPVRRQSLVEQQLREVGAVLSRDASDQRTWNSIGPHEVLPISVHPRHRQPGRHLCCCPLKGTLQTNQFRRTEVSLEFILASAVGSMRRLLENAVRYAKERKQLGKPIGEFQLVGSKIADIKLCLETARYMLYHCAWKLENNAMSMMEASMAKLYISESWIRSCENAIQIHGGYGYMTEYELERELGDAIGSRMYSGTSEIQRTLIASLLQM